ncbi:MAG: ATP-binding cassette domain-containing protein [Candidatus Pacebacteria bacterium]|nr:ATP-binding cassette domain-containing protein [Candidatus Paceibacterota bacterium]
MAKRKKKANKKQPVLELRKVSKHYHLGNQLIKALDKVNFALCSGDFVAIKGPSGSGKSTFLQVASILAEPTSGQIMLKGQDVTSYDEVERAHLRNQEIGFIFQKFNLLARTSAIENVALPLVYAGVSKNEREQRAKALLEKIGLGERLENKPSQLSGGQQQRVAIARALINNPSIIFADEPTGNLDSQSGSEIKKILTDLNKEGKTIMMVTHEENVAKIAKRHLFLKDGQIVSDTNNHGQKSQPTTKTSTKTKNKTRTKKSNKS